MACKIAENPPLRLLRKHLGFEPVCHSFRADCIHRLSQPEPEYNLGGPGAAIGYCQALFNKRGSHEENTIRISKLLQGVSAPWFNSHELYWGNKGDSSVSEYVLNASQPLTGDGRVPILITPLDAHTNQNEIQEILSSDSLVVPGETILVRILVSSLDSQLAAIDIMRQLITTAKADEIMPRWWPLLQGNLTLEEWTQFASLAGDLWQYANVAMNPFMPIECFSFLSEQITVAQVPIGLADGVNTNGDIYLAKGQVTLTGAPKNKAHYNIFNYFEKAKKLRYAPILLVLGPSLPEWSDQVNQDRISALIPLLDQGCKKLWHGLSDENYDMVWKFAA